MAMARVVRWTDWDGKGLEHLAVADDGTRITARSLVIGERDGCRFGLSYTLILDLIWRVREVRAEMVDGARLDLQSDGLGQWRDGHGADLARLAGCIDVDIAATPFTNTLPIRRLDLDIGESRTIKVAYVSLPNLAVDAVEQRYSRLTDNRYLYEGLSTGFVAELEVDSYGIVGDYPGVFRMAP